LGLIEKAQKKRKERKKRNFGGWCAISDGVWVVRGRMRKEKKTEFGCILLVID